MKTNTDEQELTEDCSAKQSQTKKKRKTKFIRTAVFTRISVSKFGLNLKIINGKTDDAEIHQTHKKVDTSPGSYQEMTTVLVVV